MMPISTPRVPYRTPGEGTGQWVDLCNALLTRTLASYDSTQSLKSPVGTHCVGFSYNLAGFLLAAGEQVMSSSIGIWMDEILVATLHQEISSVLKGNRSAMPLSRIAPQSPAGAARGQADDIRNETNELLRIKDYLYNELAKKTGQSSEKSGQSKNMFTMHAKINKDLSGMKRFNAQKALEYGLIDRIIRPPPVDVDARPRDPSAGLG
ncbi:hypothetical protein GH714_009588 [Hevea brasiliensis]|uniref:ATP-dependent Clp protease proteolytic subunit n=1 Tax=Hevea brasiliensis TaxID=3981 RepID=A0A6A6MHF1_HEVBR|nr:hypothetical protein GH714_009588 [Hevea brasiliensis]